MYPLPFFALFTVPFLLPVLGGPNKSSMELALLIPVPGLLGGADGGPFDCDLVIRSGGGASPPASPISPSARASGLLPRSEDEEKDLC